MRNVLGQKKKGEKFVISFPLITMQNDLIPAHKNLYFSTWAQGVLL